MQKHLFILILMAVVISFSQPTAYGQPPKCEFDMSVSIYHQAGLPIYSPGYYPCGNWYDYHIWFTIEDIDADGWSEIAFYVADNHQYSYDTRNYNENGRYDYYGTNFTGSGIDFLKIDQTGGSGTDHFGTMWIEVEYFNKPGS